MAGDRLGDWFDNQAGQCPLQNRSVDPGELPQVASRLHNGEATVKTHAARVFDGIALRDRVRAVDHRLVRPGARCDVFSWRCVQPECLQA